MSKYTTSLYNYFKNNLTNNNDKIENHFKDIFLDFNFYSNDEKEKNDFINQFCIFYLMDEIAYETIYMFKLKLQNKLNLIMPKYVDLYNSKSSYKNIFYDNVVDEKTNSTNTKSQTQATTTENTSSVSDSRTSNDSNTHSDTPTINISQNYYSTKDIGNSTASGTSNQNGTGSSNFTNRESNNNDSTRTINSINKNYIDNLKDFEYLKSINEMIINECSDLFIQIF